MELSHCNSGSRMCSNLPKSWLSYNINAREAGGEGDEKVAYGSPKPPNTPEVEADEVIALGLRPFL